MRREKSNYIIQSVSHSLDVLEQFFGEDDPFIPLDTVERLKAELARHRKQAEVIVYPKAPHGFFCNERDSYRPEAARDAWERLKTFFATHLKR